MPRKKDYAYLIDKKYNYLTVVEKDIEKSTLEKRQFFKCVCECGNFISIRANDLERETYKSCGCKRHTDSNYKDIKDETFNMLKVLEYAYTLNNKAHWVCLCQCGKVVIVQQSNLNSGHTKSCGCLKSGSNIRGNNRNIRKHFRNVIAPISIDLLKKSNYKCFLTKSSDNLEVHHKKSFTDLYLETILELNLPLHDNMSKYSKENIKDMNALFIEKHNDDILVVLNKDIHILFHKLYGYKNTTKEQFDNFVKQYF